MKTINVEITGVTPLLMNSPATMIDTAKGIVKTTEKRDVIKDADKLAYKKKGGELYVPASAVKGCIVNASAYKKFGKNVARPIVAGGVFITPDEIGLGTKKYDVDIRTVVIQRARVVKGRPKIEKWKLGFKLIYNESLINDDTMIKEILIEAGQRIGLLDFRPQKLGSFGMFEVSKWQVEK